GRRPSGSRRRRGRAEAPVVGKAYGVRMMQTPPAFPPFPAPPGLDPNFLINQVAPLIGFVVVVVVGAMALRSLFRSPVGEALAERIREGSRRRRHWKGLGGEWMDAPAEGAEAERRVAALAERVRAPDGQGREMAERVGCA